MEISGFSNEADAIHILDVAADLNRHIYSDEGLQSETSVPILFTTV